MTLSTANWSRCRRLVRDAAHTPENECTLDRVLDPAPTHETHGRPADSPFRTDVPPPPAPARPLGVHDPMDESVCDERDRSRGAAFGTGLHDSAEAYALGKPVSPSNDAQRVVAQFIDSVESELIVEETPLLPRERTALHATPSAASSATGRAVGGELDTHYCMWLVAWKQHTVESRRLRARSAEVRGTANSPDRRFRRSGRPGGGCGVVARLRGSHAGFVTRASRQAGLDGAVRRRDGVIPQRSPSAMSQVAGSRCVRSARCR